MTQFAFDMWNMLVQTMLIERLYGIDRIARNFSRPESGIFGAIISYLLKKVNLPIERNAVKHLDVRPNHAVLEIGFGLGYGIQHVLDIIKEGDGSVHGLDISDEMVRRTARRFQKEIKDKKVNICIGDVASMPYEDNTFDRVFHTSSYFYWPDMDEAAKEIYRVMRKDSVMVTIVVPDKLKMAVKKGALKYGDPDQTRYIDALRNNNFVDVQVQDFYDAADGLYPWYQATFAYVKKK
ncbi:putative methyltransferase YrhH isoform X2 [Lineus longissimus]|uniref:putative methyltransferase YrhH isoform X2 n=2 Tax=Lineus longissimus TaxID=88925 RepID=UPI00315DA5E1